MAKSWNQLSVLIAGCGSIGKRHAGVLHELGIRDIRACDPSPEARNSLSKIVPSVKLYESYRAALDDAPDAVVICTPLHLHIPMAVEAAERGIHILCEKPISDTTEGTAELQDLADRRGVKVMVAHCFRYHRGITSAMDCLRQNRIGRLISIRSIIGEYLPDIRADYRTLHPAGSLGAFDLMHDLDLALWAAGSPIRKTCCFYGSYSDIGLDAPDLVEFLIEFENRTVASVHLDFFHQPRKRQFDMICTGGSISVEFARWDRCTVTLYDGAAGALHTEEFETDRNDMFRAEDEDFLRAVAEDRPIHCSIAQACMTVSVIQNTRER